MFAVTVTNDAQCYIIIPCKRLVQVFCVCWFLFRMFLCVQHSSPPPHAMSIDPGAQRSCTIVRGHAEEKEESKGWEGAVWLQVSSPSSTILVSAHWNHNYYIPLQCLKEKTKSPPNEKERCSALRSSDRAFCLNPSV